MREGKRLAANRPTASVRAPTLRCLVVALAIFCPL